MIKYLIVIFCVFILCENNKNDLEKTYIDSNVNNFDGPYIDSIGYIFEINEDSLSKKDINYYLNKLFEPESLQNKRKLIIDSTLKKYNNIFKDTNLHSTFYLITKYNLLKTIKCENFNRDLFYTVFAQRLHCEKDIIYSRKLFFLNIDSVFLISKFGGPTDCDTTKNGICDGMLGFMIYEHKVRRAKQSEIIKYFSNNNEIKRSKGK